MSEPIVQRCDRHSSDDGPVGRCCFAAEVVRLRNRAVLVDGMRETERAQLNDIKTGNYPLTSFNPPAILKA